MHLASCTRPGRLSARTCQSAQSRAYARDALILTLGLRRAIGAGHCRILRESQIHRGWHGRRRSHRRNSRRRGSGSRCWRCHGHRPQQRREHRLCHRRSFRRSFRRGHDPRRCWFLRRDCDLRLGPHLGLYLGLGFHLRLRCSTLCHLLGGSAHRASLLFYGALFGGTRCRRAHLCFCHRALFRFSLLSHGQTSPNGTCRYTSVRVAPNKSAVI